MTQELSKQALRHFVCTRCKQLASQAPIGLRTEEGRKGCLAATTPFAAVVRQPRREGRGRAPSGRRREKEGGCARGGRRRGPSLAPSRDEPIDPEERARGRSPPAPPRLQPPQPRKGRRGAP